LDEKIRVTTRLVHANADFGGGMHAVCCTSSDRTFFEAIGAAFGLAVEFQLYRSAVSWERG
jgi:hypothetical protein